jgi:hypothetical protein
LERRDSHESTDRIDCSGGLDGFACTCADDVEHNIFFGQNIDIDWREDDDEDDGHQGCQVDGDDDSDYKGDAEQGREAQGEAPQGQGAQGQEPSQGVSEEVDHQDHDDYYEELSSSGAALLNGGRRRATGTRLEDMEI